MAESKQQTFATKLAALSAELERKREVHRRRQSAVEEMWRQQSELKAIESDILEVLDYLDSLGGFSLRSLSLSITGGREEERQKALAIKAKLEEGKARLALEIDKRRQAIERLDMYIENLKSLEKQYDRMKRISELLDAADRTSAWKNALASGVLYDLELECGGLIEEIARARESIEYMMQAGAELDWALRSFDSVRDMNIWGAGGRRWGGRIAEGMEAQERMSAQKHLDMAKAALAKSCAYLPKAFVPIQADSFMMRADYVFDGSLFSLVSHLQITRSMEKIIEVQGHIEEALRKLEDRIEAMIRRRNELAQQRLKLLAEMGLCQAVIPPEDV